MISERLQGGILVLSAYSGMQRSIDSAFKFEQESNFWYLTGIEEPDWWVIIDGSRAKSWLVSPDLSDIAKVFEGGLSPDEAAAISGIDSVINAEDATSLLRDIARTRGVVYSLGGFPGSESFNFTLNPSSRNLWKKLERIFNSVQDARLELSRLRAIKQPVEIRAIKKAIKVTAEAFTQVKEKLPELQYEYQVEAEFTHYIRSKGAHGHAYDPIVASGKNACTLHYSDNSSRMRSGQMVLLDVGARYEGYAADITRTYAFGKPASFVCSVHERVEAAHHEIVELLQPGLSVVDYHDRVDQIMKRALIDLKLIKSFDDEDYRRYFPHAISHGLGIDVHDSLGRAEEFKPGMVLTVEPGVYIPEKNIGVRIEDNILITETGHENLSRHLSTGF